MNISTVRTLQEKISNSELLEVASQDIAKPISILIELDLPRRHAKLAPSRTRNSSQRTLVRVLPLNQEQQSEANMRIEQTKDFLEKTLGVSPRWLPSSQSFVAKVTPRQLQEIVTLDAVKAIWPNNKKTFTHATVRCQKPS